ncbi:MAG: alpha,alpha-trehalase TreF [Bacteroidota bacterium]
MKYINLLFLIFLLGCTSIVEEQKTVLDPLATPDELYPDLFERVQLEKVFQDGKTFVDATPKRSVDSINLLYEQRSLQAGLDNAGDFKAFIMENFDIPLSISSNFQSDTSKTAVEHVESLWPVLTRPADKVVEGSTLIPLPYEYIVPGGRFREVYYWDSYFTMLGLMESEEYELVENILDNFAYLIDTIGHIPNGNRVYYKTRSQPPFFAQMVSLYSDERGTDMLLKYAASLRKEYTFWMSRSEGEDVYEHTVITRLGILNRYYDRGNDARQESYREDFELVEENDGGEKMYRDLRSGAESGWDYSSRWFADGQNMSTIETTDILPVDLNALLYGFEEILLSIEPVDSDFSKELQARMNARKRFISEWCWNEDGTYEDYNWVTKKQMGVKSLAMMYPLFFKMVSQEQADQVAQFIKENMLKPGGVITTLNDTGQQWDAPNGWAPLQWMTIIGLDNYGHKELAKDIAQRWVTLNEKVYKNTGKFVEKYNVEDISLEAGGGEYPVQDGFGWSNGVYLALKTYLTKE